MKSVSNALTMWKLKALTEGGVNVSSILNKCDISSYELEKNNGRISQSQHYGLMLETLKYNDIFLAKKISIENFYQLFPDLFGLCLNEKSAYGALESFIRYRVVMGNSDICNIKHTDDSVLIEYLNEGPSQLVNGSAVGNFMLFCDIAKKYLSEMSLQVGFMGNPITSEKLTNDLFKSKCLFNQGKNSILIRDKHLFLRSDFYNKSLSELQKLNLEKSCQKLNEPKLFSHTIAEMIKTTINSDLAGGEGKIFDSICNSLKQSRWTVNKRLKQENTSFTDILKHVRFDLSCQLLTETNKSIREISEITCFATPAIFSRFFSSHANTSPIKYRNKR